MRLPMVSSALLPPLMDLCQHTDVELARHGVGTIANLAESKRTHKMLAGRCHMSLSLTGLFAQRITCFPFMSYGLSYSMT
jgi:hypothetical protein